MALHSWGCSRNLNPPVCRTDRGEVVGEVAEPESLAAEVIESAVDGLGGAVAGPGGVEAGQDVRDSLGEGAPEGDEALRPWSTGLKRFCGSTKIARQAGKVLVI